MKHVDTFRLAILVWLSFAGGLSSRLTAAIPAQTGNPVEVISLKQLQTVLSSPSLRSDEVKDLNITADGILVDQTVSAAAGTFRMHGGPLIRAEGFTETLLDIQAGADVTIENTIDGAERGNIAPPIRVEENATLRLTGEGRIQNARPQNGADNMGVLVNGTFILDGGTLNGNIGPSDLVSINGTFTFKSGRISDNETRWTINFYRGTFNLYGNAVLSGNNTEHEIFMGDNNPIQVYSALSGKLPVQLFNTDPSQSEIKAGTVLAKGAGNYLLSASDAAVFSVPTLASKGLSPQLAGNANQIVLAGSSDPGGSEITTAEELQKAIDESTGTADSPTVITIPNEGLQLTSKIIINGKYIKLTGGTIWNAVMETTRMFEIKSGKLILENIILDGYGYPAMPPQYCTFVFMEGGEFILSKGAVLQNAKCHWDVLNAVVVKGGHFYMEDGTITKNTCELGGLIYVYSNGSFTMKGGHIYDNTVGRWGSVFISSNFRYYAGNITHNNNEDCLYIQGNFIVYGGNRNDMIDKITFAKTGKILLVSKLYISLYISALSGDFTDGSVIVEGSDGYTLTAEDLAQIRLSKELNWTLKLINNTIILVKKSEGGITSAQDLQKAIDEAPAGSIENPTTITISEQINISQTLAIKGKHIKLTGKTLQATSLTTANVRMFELTGGASLTLESIILDGKCNGYCSFVRADATSSLIISAQAILQNAKGNPNWTVLEINGTLIQNGGSIENNRGEKGAIVVLSGSSKWIYNSGNIQKNHAISDNQVYSIVSSSGTAQLKGGEILANEGIALLCGGSILLQEIAFNGNTTGLAFSGKGTVTLESNRLLSDPVYYGCKSEVNYFLIKKALVTKMQIHFVSTHLKEGYVLAKGSNYTLTSSDLEKFVLSGNLQEWSLKLENNTILLTKSGVSTGIDTQEKLQAAIDASNGTASAPATITIANKEIPIYSSLMIRNKYVKLTGGTLKNAATADLRMFDVRSGYLGLTHITLDGNQKQAHGYCTLIEMNGGNCEILEGTKLTQALARGGRDAVVVVPQGKLTFKEGEISGNTSEGGDIVWVSGSGNFTMQGGSIRGNANSGRYIMAGIQMTNGAMALNGGQIADNSGSRYGVYATQPFTLAGAANLKEVIILSGESKLLIPSALKNTVTIGFMKSHMPSGTVVASGSNYTLTEADAQKFTYRYANTYGFRLQDNQIVLVNLDAQNKTFTLQTTPSRGGTVTLSKSTAKENEQITVTAKPEKGKKLYADGLRYNNNKMTPTTQPNIYTFQMPPANVTVTAGFIPELVTVKPDTTGLGPSDTNPVPEITDLPGLIEGFGGSGDINPSQPTDFIPKPTTLGKNDLPEPLSGQVKQGESGGDDVIGSLEQLISIVSKAADGTPLKTKVIKQLSRKTTIRIYLPDRLIVSEQLRASGTASYYILNQCEDQVMRIVPAFDAEANTLTFDTDKLGTFVVMNARSSTANEPLSSDATQVSIVNGEIRIEHLAAGDYYAIYDLSGKLLKKERSNGQTIRYLPEVNGTYIVQYPSGTQKIYFSK